jgi:hypothetical protein
MDITTEENKDIKEKNRQTILDEINKNFKLLVKNSPPELKEEIQNSFNQFYTLTQGPEKDQYQHEQIEILNSIINTLSRDIKNSENINDETKKYLFDLKKSVYKMNIFENKLTHMKRSYHNGQYEGGYLNGKREGHGVYEYDSGDKYEGEYKNDLKDGKGKYEFSNGDIYEGYYKKGYFDGKGIYKYADGEIYTGEYKKDLRDGQGTYKYKNGNKYEGQWKEGKKHGKGTFIYSATLKCINSFSFH